ncbi:putative RDD family membrane protein YckC [Kribbella voronezhensis]|uniref:Putative RDD family membrane protein YckC n=1 Tax=Kribbella voronezhensis TaxID=2512212 RepID=A0A4R7TAC6_9ACTN|nr:RDD family protein [Kribbella voronezhensis]TDU88954.1 putative RDD family membrane protein YckC [Kribbella voronezhensis]
MSFPHGWYDDPKDLSSQRYWDGTAWTDHRRPRPGPPPYEGEFGRPQQQPAQAPQYGQQQHYGQPQYGQPHQGQPQHGGPQYGQQGFGYGPVVPATPDGVPLSGWWKRVGARFLDGLIVMVVSLPLTGYFWYHYLQAALDYESDMFDSARAGSTPRFNTTLPWDVYKWILPATGIALLVYFVYEFFFLTRKGATPGKMAVGISVRLRDVAGPPTPVAVLKRFGLYGALSILGAVPFVGTLFGLLGLLDYLWPLWDDKKQALHDKVADTNVVVGNQTRHR